MKNLTLTAYGKTYPVRVRVETYEDYRNLCVSREVFSDGYWEEWDTITVNLSPRFNAFCSFIDVNNCGEKCVHWLTENGFGSLTSRVERSGFCVYPEFKFSEQKLREQNPEGVERHMALWNKSYGGWKEKSEANT